MGMFEYCKISVSLYLFNISVLLRFVGLVFCFILYCYCIRSWQRFVVVFLLNPLSANPTKWSNLRKLPTNCLSVFDHFVGLALKELNLLNIRSEIWERSLIRSRKTAKILQIHKIQKGKNTTKHYKIWCQLSTHLKGLLISEEAIWTAVALTKQINYWIKCLTYSF